MNRIRSVAELTELGRLRLSGHFFMRDLVTGARLGGAFFASIRDVGTALANVCLKGILASRLVKRWVQLLKTGPEAREDFRRVESAAARELYQNYWWRPCNFVLPDCRAWGRNLDRGSAPRVAG